MAKSMQIMIFLNYQSDTDSTLWNSRNIFSLDDIFILKIKNFNAILQRMEFYILLEPKSE